MPHIPKVTILVSHKYKVFKCHQRDQIGETDRDYLNPDNYINITVSHKDNRRVCPPEVERRPVIYEQPGESAGVVAMIPGSDEDDAFLGGENWLWFNKSYALNRLGRREQAVATLPTLPGRTTTAQEKANTCQPAKCSRGTWKRERSDRLMSKRCAILGQLHSGSSLSEPQGHA